MHNNLDAAAAAATAASIANTAPTNELALIVAVFTHPMLEFTCSNFLCDPVHRLGSDSIDTIKVRAGDFFHLFSSLSLSFGSGFALLLITRAYKMQS